MDEQTAYALSLALDAKNDLSVIRDGITDVKALIESVIAQPADLAEDEAAAIEVPNDYLVEQQFYADSLSFLSMQTTLMIFMLVSLLVLLGVQLWQCFSDKWKG